MSLGLYTAAPNQATFVVELGPPQQPPLTGSIYRWHRAEPQNVVTASGDKVTQWNDLSGHDNHLAQGVANERPTFIASTGSFNGQSCIQFDGVQDVMFDVHTALTGSGITFGVIFRKNRLEGLVDGILSLSQEGFSDFDGDDRFNYNTGRASPASTDDELEWGNASPGIKLDNASSGRTDWVVIRVEGASVDHITQILTGSLGFDADVANFDVAFDIDRTQIGARNGSTQNFLGDYLEVIVYQAALSDENMFALDNYLSSSLAGTLSGSA